jgi:hypothetical protein
MATSDLRNYLLKGEKIIWSGRPAQGLLLSSHDWFLIPFSLMWGGFAVFWEASALVTQAPSFMKLWGIPFVLIGLYLILGRFLLDSWIRQEMQYALTNKRILISWSRPFSKFTAISLQQLPEANLTEHVNGRGTIRFGQPASLWGRGNGFSSWAPSLDPSPQFISIENARSVFEQIQRALQSDS